MDRGAWWATVPRVAKSRTRLSNFTSLWIIQKAREFQENIYFCFIDHAKAFDYVDHSKLWKILKEMGIADHLTCLLRNVYGGQETTVRTRLDEAQPEIKIAGKNFNILRYADDTTLMAESEEEPRVS